jgi:hypothetical protein
LTQQQLLYNTTIVQQKLFIVLQEQSSQITTSKSTVKQKRDGTIIITVMPKPPSAWPAVGPARLHLLPVPPQLLADHLPALVRLPVRGPSVPIQGWVTSFPCSSYTRVVRL